MHEHFIASRGFSRFWSLLNNKKMHNQLHNLSNRNGKIMIINNPITLPLDGYSRFKQFKPFINISREKFRQLVRSGCAPQPIYLSSRCAMYKNSDLHDFLANIANYRAEGF